MSAAAAASAATVRTWFQVVQLARYPAHRPALSGSAGATDASALFFGTLHTTVTNRLPTR